MLRHMPFCVGISILLGAAIAPAVAAVPAKAADPTTSAQQEVVLAAGDLQAVLSRKPDGVELLSLTDLAKHRQLLAQKPLPLFAVTLRNVESKAEVRLQADAGWEQVQIAATKPAEGFEIAWQSPKDKRLGELRVMAVAALDSAAGAIRWKLSVENVGKPWSVRRVAFPQLALDASSPQLKFLYPSGCGQLQQGPWPAQFSYGGTYPNGWTTMQFMAAYDTQSGTGLYCALHDPLGGTKDIRAEGQPASRAIVATFDVPAENMDAAGNGYRLPGEAVWQVLHGDWFDAAMIYRAWVRQHAAWYPKLGPDGRADTPPWMRELPVWVRTRGDPKTVVPAVTAFAKAVNVPVGFHWYDWHQVPFDNDYPHYFPVKEGFGEAVRTLQANGVYVMPYINGRLWDTRDKGAADFEFSRVALPAAAKDETGKPYVETYQSKEADGSPVRLAVMCPATERWQATVRETVLRLFGEYGVRGVYIDQVAAAHPVLCFDHAHGHPAGGGHWWTASYNKLIEAIRQVKPADRMLTSECNAEPYARNFDGYLTWHWCRDRQVPAFSAVYGGAIQMFGRAYRGGETKDLALRMKAGQQLVFGEQIGWFEPALAMEPKNLDFVRQVVGLRWQLRRYFHAGQMARPPKLQGAIPTVRADWQWDNPGWVTTDAVMIGAWQLPDQHRCILLFANVGDQTVTAQLQLDAAAYGLPNKPVKATTVTTTGPGAVFQSPPALRRDVTFPARSAFAWELTPAD